MVAMDSPRLPKGGRASGLSTCNTNGQKVDLIVFNLSIGVVVIAYTLVERPNRR